MCDFESGDTEYTTSPAHPAPTRKQPTRYRLLSSGMLSAAGLIAWARNGYAFKRDRVTMVKIVSGTWSAVSPAVARKLLSGKLAYTVDQDAAVVFEVVL